MMHGKGIHIKNSTVYVGKFRNNKLNGPCKIYYEDGYYEGNVVDN